MTTATLEAPASPHFGRVQEWHDSDRIVGHMTLAEYVDFESAATEKHEFIGGKVVRMAGGSIEHNRISFDTGTAFSEAIAVSGLNCEVLGSDQKVYVHDKLILHPDISIVCGATQVDQNDGLRNPLALIEVLSASTAAFDLGRKFEYYRTIVSLKHYIVIDQYAVSVTHYAKIAGNLWAIVGEHHRLSDTLTLTIDQDKIAVPLSKMYRRVSFVDEDAAEEAEL